jgi:hypothetical protein
LTHGLGTVGSHIDYALPLLFEERLQDSFQGKASVIGSDGDLHGAVHGRVVYLAIYNSVHCPGTGTGYRPSASGFTGGALFSFKSSMFGHH